MFFLFYWIADSIVTDASPYLRHAKTKIVNFDDCQSTYSYKTEILDSMLCAGYISGKIDACTVSNSLFQVIKCT